MVGAESAPARRERLPGVSRVTETRYGTDRSPWIVHVRIEATDHDEAERMRNYLLRDLPSLGTVTVDVVRNIANDREPEYITGYPVHTDEGTILVPTEFEG
jgi:hypothetical protein